MVDGIKAVIQIHVCFTNRPTSNKPIWESDVSMFEFLCVVSSQNGDPVMFGCFMEDGETVAGVSVRGGLHPFHRL